MWWFGWAMVACLAACTSPEEQGSPADTGVEAPPLDPDVSTYVPGHFPAADPQRVVFLGDSITAGYGVPNPENAYVQLLLDNNEARWPDHAEADLGARFPELEVLDVSVSGATTDSLIAVQLPRVDAAWGPSVAGETLVVITIGGNDMSEGTFSGDPAGAVDSVVANLEVIADHFLDPARFPDGAYVYITNVYEPTDGTGQVDECFYGLDLSAVIEEFERLLDESRALAEAQGWAWVDLRGHFLGHGFRYDEEGDWTDEEDPTLWFQDDCIHPNPRGHHEIRRLFLAAIDGEPLPLEIAE